MFVVGEFQKIWVYPPLPSLIDPEKMVNLGVPTFPSLRDFVSRQEDPKRNRAVVNRPSVGWVCTTQEPTPVGQGESIPYFSFIFFMSKIIL